MTSQTTVFDGTSVDSTTGKLVLRIEENRRWQQIDVMHRELGAKVRSCVRYLRSPEFADEYSVGLSDTIVRLVAAEQPGAATLELFERIRYELAKHGIDFEYTVASDMTSRVSRPAYPHLPGALAPEVPPRPASPSKPKKPVEVDAADPARSQTAITRIVLLVVWLAVAGSATLWGLEYYVMPTQERAYSELHEMFKPNGTVGIWYGTIGSLMIIIGTAMYSLRKRFRFLQRAGRLTRWLQFHIFLCTLGPYLVVLHTSFKFGGIASIAFWSMAAVVASGVLGRYLFAHIPGNINSRRAVLQVLENQQQAIVEAFAGSARVKAGALDQALALGRQRKPKGLLHAFVIGIHNDLTKRWLKRKIDSRLTLLGMAQADRERAAALVLKQVELERRIALLVPFQRMFAYWHVVHLPMSTVMCVFVLLHIIVAALFGYANFF